MFKVISIFLYFLSSFDLLDLFTVTNVLKEQRAKYFMDKIDAFSSSVVVLRRGGRRFLEYADLYAVVFNLNANKYDMPLSL